MAETIHRDELKKMIDKNESFQLIDVLSQEKFNDFHLPGARNVPVDENFEENIQRAVPDKDDKVVVYCANEECDASPKAAKKMEDAGYTNVLDYEAGKEDWKEAGLQVEK